MTSSQPEAASAASVSSNSSVNDNTVLYANKGFQVRLRTLAPQAKATIPASHKAWPLIGQLDCNGTVYQPGKSIGQGEGSPEAELRNPSSSEVAMWLEILSGEFEPLAPQGETESRPWGTYTVLRDDPAFKLKQLAVQPGSRLSLQRHQKREEHWMIVAGRPEITLDDQTLRPVPGEAVLIPLQSWHRISNPSPANDPVSDVVELIEVQLGEYFGEDDIERKQDDYGRA